MDSLIAAAARALSKGDPLGALDRVALRDDPPALALRGIAMAQLGELPRARELLRRATRGFGPGEAMARARCVVAESEVALAMRDLADMPTDIDDTVAVLETHGDTVNAWHMRLIAVRRLLLTGRLEAAEHSLDRIEMTALPPALRAVAELAAAELTMRSLRIGAALAAFDRAMHAAATSQVAALRAEVADARTALDRPAARSFAPARYLHLDEVEALFGSDALVVDACRRGLRAGAAWLPLARRPVLFAIAQALAEAWPGDVDRNALIERVFRVREPDETLRARLRVQIGRLRAVARPMLDLQATGRGYVLVPASARSVVVLMPPVDGEQAALLALLSDGAAWSTSALALALDDSQRTVQRALVELEASNAVRSIGRARSQRWLAPPIGGFTTILLLPQSTPDA